MFSNLKNTEFIALNAINSVVSKSEHSAVINIYIYHLNYYDLFLSSHQTLSYRAQICAFLCLMLYSTGPAQQLETFFHASLVLSGHSFDFMCKLFF